MSFGLFLRYSSRAGFVFDVFASPRDDGDDGLDEMARLRRREKERTSLDRRVSGSVKVEFRLLFVAIVLLFASFAPRRECAFSRLKADCVVIPMAMLRRLVFLDRIVPRARLRPGDARARI